MWREILKLDEGLGLAAQLVGHHRTGTSGRIDEYS